MRGAGPPLLVLLAAGCHYFDAPLKPDGPEEIVEPPLPPLPGSEDEGGEIRVEFVRFAGGNAAARVTAFLYKDPGVIKFFPFPNPDGCSDASAKEHWPTATNPVAQRVYFDPGTVLIEGGPAPLTISRRDDEGKDVMGRTHAAGAWFSHFLGETGTDGPTHLMADTRIVTILTGSSEFPGQVFDAALYMPHDFELEDPGTGPVALEADTPLTFTWTTPSEPPPSDVDVFSHVTFVDGATQEIVVLCIEPNDGSVTVPAAMIDLVRAKAPQGGTLRRQAVSHAIRELVTREGRTGRRIDFVAAWGYETRFTVP